MVRYITVQLTHLTKSIRYINTSKIFNLIIILTSHLFSIFGIQLKLRISPSFISIEPANFCNLECPECPVSGRASIVKKSKTNVIDALKWIDELKANLFHIIFYFQGEPFLNDALFEMIKYAHNAKIYTSISTNGHYLSPENAKKIVDAGLDKLIVSIDGSTQETYEKYRVGGVLNKVCQGVRNVVEYKKSSKSITPIIEIQFIVFKTNEHQLGEIKLLAKELDADKIAFKTAQLHDFENGNPFLTTINKYARYKKAAGGKYVLKNKQPNHCWRLWSGAVITTNGDVLPCCFDKTAENSFGNLQNNSFINIWKNKTASNFRERILQNRKQFEMCRNCTSKF